jgi:hypothetical protein
MIRLGVAVLALLVWGYGYSVDDERLRLAGIVLLAVSLLLRFAGPRSPRRGHES